ncbi:CHAD domain-containing protein [Pseudomonas borbori]
MSRFNDDLLAQVLQLQVRVYACCERLRADTDSEALHDLRIALRKLRSLLKPIGDLAGCVSLQQHAAALGRLSGPLRDLQVLSAELQRLGVDQDADARQLRLREGYAALLDSAQLSNLLNAFDEFPPLWHRATAAGELRGLDKSIRKRLAKQQRRLIAALADPAHDRHQVRLLIKRARYGAEAYPQLVNATAADQRYLKQAQSALGTWHDYLQWLAQAERSADLAPCVEAWRRALGEAERKADEALQSLQRRFA